MNKEVINVGLYGGKSIFGGKETPIEASVISCDKHDSCSYFKNGQCLNVRSPLSSRCKHGSINNIKGYTSRAKKYYQFKDEWKDHEQYGKLNYPPNKLGIIDGEVIFPYPYIRIEEKDGSFRVTDPSLFGSSISYIPNDKFTVEFIYIICTFRPQAMMGGEISSYRKEIVPLFLAHLEEILPEKYKELVEKYPDLSGKIDHVGRKALLKTVNPSYVHYKSNDYPNLNNEWYWDGEYLRYQSGYVSSFSVVKDYEIQEITLKPTNKSFVKITNNDQVSDHTVFLD